MSSHEEHHEHDGGHELEDINTKVLFQLVFGLSGLVIVACIMVAGWFYKQNAAIQKERAAQLDNFTVREELKLRDEKDLEDIGKAVDAMLKNANTLHGGAAPAGWVHPDDVAKPAAAVDKAGEGDPKPEAAKEAPHH